MRRAPFLLILVAMALAACGRPAANDAAQAGKAPDVAAPAAVRTAAAPEGNAAAGDRVLRSETVEGVFTGWEMGDYLWAHVSVPGRAPISAQPGPSPIDLFLDARRGRPLTLEIATVRADIPEAGGEIEIERITGARDPAGTAQAWWQGLSEGEKQAAQRRFETGALSGG